MSEQAGDQQQSVGVALFSREDVARHSSFTDAWIILHDDVLDITKFIASHPGGEDALLDVMGRCVSA